MEWKTIKQKPTYVDVDVDDAPVGEEVENGESN